ncbi:hypothetical protein G3480_01240 [Thiorhodococcus mannitoliphagus]|uniref:HYR domain-containing protein n=1 Tax=Thiorhodococcus mannitoliphagus TaxID=329406 RepID=A0A6P1DSG8_9GAMM|nr:hypothetical protein [Thiorhodococcus mannitoliphagus]NEX18952.1 hypothetical protein [Thiorhodococcus mannitoliphagus]
MQTQLTPVAAAVSLALGCGNAWAIDYYLAAKAYDKALPDGTSVPMWGYVEDTDGTCFNASDDAARVTCVEALADPVAPGPRLSVPSGQTALRIYLSNALPEPTSIVITGQEMPIGNYPGVSPSSGPTWDDGSTGNRTSSTQRVRSFVPEAPANGGRMGYIWNNGQGTPIDRPGSFIYHSGTWPQKQVYMGLSGLVTKDAAAEEVYPGVSYTNEVVLFYSDLDPAFNAAVSNGSLSTAIDRHPTWFLVNGEPFVQGTTEDLEAGAAGEATLLRLASTATDTHVAVLQGMDMTIHAEDGLVYTYQQGASSVPAPRVQYSAMLPPAKTKDAIVVAPEEGRYAVYDGNGYMTNPSNPAVEATGDGVGGMLRFLAFGAGGGGGPGNTAPVVTAPTPDPLTVSAPLCETTLSSGDGAVAAWLALATAADNEDGALTPTNDAPTDLAIGDTLVTFSATDSDGAAGTATATIQVAETPNTPPTLTAPDPVEISVPNGTTTVPATDAAIAAWLASVAATDTEDGPLTASSDAPAELTPGAVTTVNFIATDACGLEATGSSTVTVVEQDVPTPTVTLYFSTQGGGNNNPVPGVAAPYDDADIYSVDTDTNYARLYDAIDDLGLPGNANIDGLSIDGNILYLSFAAANTTVPGLGTVPDEDVVAYDTSSSTWSTYFDGSLCGLDASNGRDNGRDIDAISVSGGTLYFSTVGGGNSNSVGGVTGPYDDADVYTWSGEATGAANCARALDGSTVGLPGNADIDGLTVVGGTYYMSFIASGGTTVPPLGAVQDESVVSYDGSTWTLYFSGVGQLDSNNGQNLDAIQVVPTP